MYRWSAYSCWCRLSAMLQFVSDVAVHWRWGRVSAYSCWCRLSAMLQFVSEVAVHRRWGRVSRAREWCCLVPGEEGRRGDWHWRRILITLWRIALYYTKEQPINYISQFERETLIDVFHLCQTAPVLIYVGPIHNHYYFRHGLSVQFLCEPSYHMIPLLIARIDNEYW